jgi:hypothetical protein
MEKYEPVLIEVIRFDNEDIITTSDFNTAYIPDENNP